MRPSALPRFSRRRLCRITDVVIAARAGPKKGSALSHSLCVAGLLSVYGASSPITARERRLDNGADDSRGVSISEEGKAALAVSARLSVPLGRFRPVGSAACG